jgi:hypothetical protein
MPHTKQKMPSKKEVDFTHSNQIGEAGTPPPLSTLPPFLNNWHNKPYAAISPSRPELSVHGKNIVVTGGDTGIGASIALSFAKAGTKSIRLIGRREDRLKVSANSISAQTTTTAEYAVADVLIVPR